MIPHTLDLTPRRHVREVDSEPECYYPGIRHCKFYWSRDEKCFGCGYGPGSLVEVSED